MSKDDEEVELVLELYHETDKALLVSEDGGKTKVWLPKSQLEYNNIDDNSIRAVMPLWLAEKSKFAGY